MQPYHNFAIRMTPGKQNTSVSIIECPRDAMQGWPSWIPTDRKIRYINQLLKVGFDTIDFGSFVSPALIQAYKRVYMAQVSTCAL